MHRRQKGDFDDWSTVGPRSDGIKGTIMKRFDNQTVIVTGAACGMGASHARGFAAEGAKVVIADILEQEGRTLGDVLGVPIVLTTTITKAHR
jgi:hypothetical protein